MDPSSCFTHFCPSLPSEHLLPHPTAEHFSLSFHPLISKPGQPHGNVRRVYRISTFDCNLSLFPDSCQNCHKSIRDTSYDFSSFSRKCTQQILFVGKKYCRNPFFCYVSLQAQNLFRKKICIYTTLCSNVSDSAIGKKYFCDSSLDCVTRIFFTAASVKITKLPRWLFDS